MWKSWSRGDKLTAIGLILTAVAAIAAVIVVPEFRRWLHLDKSETAQTVTAAPQQAASPQSASSSQTTEPIRQEPTTPKEPKKASPAQKTTTQVSGNDNVAGNNISGDNNVTGNNNQIGPTANAPNGVAITGGTVNNPTVNNYASMSHRHPPDDQEKTAFQAPLLLQTHSRYDTPADHRR